VIVPAGKRSQILIVEQRAGSTIRLELHGEIDVVAVGQVRDAVVAALARYDLSMVVLDFRHVSFIDAIGVGELVTCHRAAAVFGATIMLENLAPFPYRQLWATGLLGLFGLASDEPPTADRPAEPGSPA
jgi:anti-sigma B factor antagonist